MSIYSQFPEQIPSVSLNFAKTKRLDSKLNFSRASTATYVDSDGLIKSTAVNTPRFDHDPLTGECRGLLVEESRINYVSNSNVFGGAVNATLTANAGIAPNNTNTAYKLQGFGTGGANAYVIINTSAPTSCTFSYYVKNINAVRARTFNDNLDFIFATESFSGNPSNKSFEKFPNGWYRLTHINYPSSNLNFGLGYATTDSILIWGPQIELGSFSTSYIPTSGSAVTRAADILSPYPLNDFKSSRIIFTPSELGNSVVPSIVVKDSQSTPEYALEISTPNKVPTVTTKFNNVIQSTATFVRPQTSTDEINLGINYEKTTGKVSICTNVTDEVNSAVVTIPETCNLKLPNGYTLNQLEIKQNCIIKSIYTWNNVTATTNNLIAFTEKSLAKNNPEKITAGIIDELYQKADPVNNGKPSLDLNFAENKSLIDNISQSNLITFSRASTATYVDSDGLIKTAAINEARFDHDPFTGECKGLLIEEARTNLVTNSIGALSNTTLSDTISPDGTLTARAWNGVGNTGSFSTSFPNTDTIYTVSFYVKSTSTSFLARSFGTSPSTRLQLSYNLATNSLILLSNSTQNGGTGTTMTPTINVESFSNGWKRIAITGYIRNESGFYFNDSSENTDYHLWGFQVEVGSFSTSYIPTSGSTVTRAADVSSITGTNFSSWYNYNASTIVIDGKPLSLSGNPRLITASGGGGENRLWAVGRDFYTSSYASGGGGQVLISYAINATSFQKYAYTFDYDSASNITTLKNTTSGQSVLTNTASGYNIPLSGANLYIGSSGDAKGHKWIRRLTYWPTRLPNTTLQAITAPPQKFEMVMDSSLPSNGVCAIITSGTVTYTVDWGDETSIETVNATGTFTKTHAYTIPKKYTVKITVTSGTFRPFYNNSIYATAITKINQTPTGAWGGFGTNLTGAFYRASNLTFIETINTTDVTNFQNAWRSCSSLVRFPPLTLSSGTNFVETWRDCTSLVHFPASRFNTSTATNYSNAFTNCALNISSIENILVSINTSNRNSGFLGIGGGTNASITTWSAAAIAAYNALVARGWAITFNA